MNNITDAIEWLKSLSVRFRPKSLEKFQEISAFTKIYVTLSDTDKDNFRLALADVATKKLLPLSAFCAELAMETSDADWLRVAVLLQVIEDFRTDYRENIRYLVLIAYSANSIGADLNKIINEVFSIASTRTEGYLNDFIKRDVELNTLDKFGIQVSLTDGRPRFVPA